MTIDQEIKHQEEISDRYARMSEYEKNNGNDGIAKDCAQCAAYHRQLAEWLTDYKELRNSLGAVKLKDMKEAVGLLQELNAENDQLTSQLVDAKRLLKLAVEDVETLAKAFAEDEPCGSFTLCSECPLCIKEGCSCKEWRYKAEALKLIGGETDEKP